MSLEKFLAKATNPQVKAHLTAALAHLETTYPQLELAVKWGKPMFSKDGAFIVGFDVAKAHLSIIPEPYALAKFVADIEAAGYGRTDNLIKITDKQELNLELLDAIIAFKLADKAGASTYFKVD